MDSIGKPNCDQEIAMYLMYTAPITKKLQSSEVKKSYRKQNLHYQNLSQTEYKFNINSITYRLYIFI